MRWREKGDTGGKAARERAEKELAEVRELRHEVRRIGDAHRSRVETNHIAEGLALIYLGGDRDR